MIRALLAVAVGGWLTTAAAAEPLGPPDSIESFFDGAIGAQVASGSTVGATIALVQDGRIVFAKGYGLASRELGVPVRSDRTLFRIGSVSKLFVWVAVMQQQAAGRLDLYADVNDYLQDFQIPPTYPVPITLRHLMTHTPGFEDRVVGLFANGPRTMGDFHANLIRMRPERIMMPGKVVSYSNYGAALAAHLVEIASGEPWDDYVEHHILTPLDMRRTSPRQPLPKPLLEDMANGYWQEQGQEVTAPFEFVALPPAGSISATANDMAAFMLELLAKGDTSVLTATARAKLFEPGFRSDPRINGVLHGPYEMSSHGEQIVGHAGDTIAFHSVLRLYPEQRMGLFLSFNSERAATARDAVAAAFDDRMFGPPELPVPRSQIHAPDRYLGTYSTVRVPVQGPARLMSLLASFAVTADPDGHLILPSAEGRVRLTEVDEGLFVSDDGRQRVAFSPDGAVAEYLFPDPGLITMRRVAPVDEPIVQWSIVGACVFIMLLIVVWPLSSFRHRGRVAVAGETSATLLAVINVALLIGFALIVAEQSNVRAVIFGLSAEFMQSLWLPVAAAALLVVQLMVTYRAWVRGFWWPTRRIHYTLLTLVGLIFVAWLNYWQLLAVNVPV
jgi:CubicO group peptidase (beta-lactamase class C family)